MHRLLEEYKAEAFGCDASSPSSAAFSPLMPCAEIPRAELELRYSQDPFVSFVVKAGTALTAAFRLVQLDRCAGSRRGDGAVEAACLRTVGGEAHEDILDNLLPVLVKKIESESADVRFLSLKIFTDFIV